MSRTAGRDCPGNPSAYKVLAGRKKRHNRAGMTGFDSGTRSRAIGIGLRRADQKTVGLDRLEIGRDMHNTRHGNSNHAGNPDQGPEMAQLRTQSIKHIVKHAALEATVEFPSMT